VVDLDVDVDPNVEVDGRVDVDSIVDLDLDVYLRSSSSTSRRRLSAGRRRGRPGEA